MLFSPPLFPLPSSSPARPPRLAAPAAARLNLALAALLWIALLLGGGWSGEARAADGRLEINQTCAVRTGCFPGDAPGFPVTIRGGGGSSFVLTSDLSLPDENTTGIRVEAIGISIDLNRFAIARDDCLLPSSLCPRVQGLGDGIQVSHVNAAGLRVSNGSIHGVGSNGIEAGTEADVEDVYVRQPGRVCVQVDVNSRVRGSRVSFCGRAGIVAGDSSLIEGNTAYQAGFERSGSGIQCGVGCRIAGNTSSANSSHGILAGNGSSVVDNVAHGNGARGLQLNGSATTFRGNTLFDNGTATVLGGVDAGGNTCNGSTTCP